jgi:sugar fermentation stimulation protein A
MKYRGPLTEAILLKRYYRFLAEVALKNKKRRMLYCPNLGPLMNCDILGSRVWFSTANRLSQGYLDSWELVEVNGGWLVCINPEHAKHLVMEGIEHNVIHELSEFHFLQSPMMPILKNGIELLLKDNGEQCFLYIEPVLFSDERGAGYFPESMGMGLSSLHELVALREAGHKAVLLYCVLHSGIHCMRPADAIDPYYGKMLRKAVSLGVEVIAYRANITLREISLESKIPVLLSEDIISDQL